MELKEFKTGKREYHHHTTEFGAHCNARFDRDNDLELTIDDQVHSPECLAELIEFLQLVQKKQLKMIAKEEVL